ncbi:MAG: hypothetical protein K6E52_07955 [Bacteroidaceae bacterium]|jgi:hypothetical protein|nr:hypothetical protein [Bacteroidaceae bacterium]
MKQTKNKMKFNILRHFGNLLITVFFAITTMTMWAVDRTATLGTSEKKTCVVVYEKQSSTIFSLGEKPKVTFVENDVQLECGSVTVRYKTESYLKMTIEERDIETDISPAKDNTFRITDSEVTAYGCSRLTIYTIDGKYQERTTADSSGTATLSTERLPKGVIIVATESKTFKILKK